MIQRTYTHTQRAVDEWNTLPAKPKSAQKTLSTFFINVFIYMQ